MACSSVGLPSVDSRNKPNASGVDSEPKMPNECTFSASVVLLERNLLYQLAQVIANGLFPGHLPLTVLKAGFILCFQSRMIGNAYER